MEVASFFRFSLIIIITSLQIFSTYELFLSAVTKTVRIVLGSEVLFFLVFCSFIYSANIVGCTIGV